ncbi:DUF3108 domain-containing protein [Telmatospirillum siberiense]|uniref:DUF3108 domain-containing protein n=1 Tax=Telmatospirillum siberiense TaxID=382514 RepID=A0A2N3PTB5_9PROT|nr:DUF3108 domain-containing protein [Telmatospirillum siberiense]PKU23627.1 hypothetical protein CWS72_15210 [Telmatospirillum siberiense]
MRQFDLRRPTAMFSLLVWLGACGSGRAAEPESLSFQAYCGGLDAAEISFVAEQQDGRYHGHLSILTHGMTHWMTRLLVDSDSWGTVTPTGFRPLTFSQVSSSREKNRRIEMRFVDEGETAEKLVDDERRNDASLAPADPDDLDPPVPEEARHHVLDPVTALFEMGRRGMAGEKTFVLAVFDGRRRYDLAVEAVGPGSHDIGGKTYDTLDLKAVMNPLYGFRPRAMDFWKNAGFNVFVGRDIGLPVKISTTTFTAETVIGLHASCRGVLPCPPS